MCVGLCCWGQCSVLRVHQCLSSHQCRAFSVQRKCHVSSCGVSTAQEPSRGCPVSLNLMLLLSDTVLKPQYILCLDCQRPFGNTALKKVSRIYLFTHLGPSTQGHFSSVRLTLLTVPGAGLLDAGACRALLLLSLGPRKCGSQLLSYSPHTAFILAKGPPQGFLGHPFIISLWTAHVFSFGCF